MRDKTIALLKEHYVAYLAGEERTGKTLAAILAAEAINVKSVLVITKKKALGGWEETLDKCTLTKQYLVTNYHQVVKIKNSFDLIILDESHNYLSSVPNPSAIWKEVKRLTKRKPIIYISATPYAQGHHMLYHQFALSDWSPWKRWKTFMDWFGSFGIPDTVWTAGGQRPVYTKSDPISFEMVKHLFITLTREQIGFDHEPEDHLHYIELNPQTKKVYNLLLKKRALNLNGWDLICDTVSKLRPALHMLEGGAMLITEKELVKKKVKIKRNYIVLGNEEKVQFIKEQWGDTKQVVIMYNYIAEKKKLEASFDNALVLQATSYAEGIDLSGYEHLIIYSQDFSTARHTQRRARQANMLRKTEINVHYLLVKDAVSEQVYQTVSVNKQNFIDSLFRGNNL